MNVRGPETGLVPPRFSIIITFYNQRDFIKDALDSALALRNTGLEVIGVDDASTDSSQEILRKYQDAVQLVCLETNQGACAARDRGASLATIVQAKSPKIILGTKLWFERALPAVPPRNAPHEITMVGVDNLLRQEQLGYYPGACVAALTGVPNWRCNNPLDKENY